MGIISSIGTNVREFAQGLRGGQCGIGCLKRKSVPNLPSSIGAEIRDFVVKDMIRQHEGAFRESDFADRTMQALHGAPRGVQVSGLVALEAWIHAGLFEKPVRSRRVGVVVAGSNLSQNYLFDAVPKFQQCPQYLTPKYPIHYLDTDHVGTVSQILGIQGEGFSVGGASASGNVAIIKGWQLIQLDLVDVCLVIGALADLSPLEMQGYFNVGAMGGRRYRETPGQACRPFDEDHEGFIYGEAGGCLILESLASVQKRGVPILAEVLGTSLLLDGNRLPNPNKDGEAQVMSNALQQARVSPDQIDYLNAHGSSSPLGDEIEVQAIKQVFGANLSRLWINSTKGLTGHCLTAAGVVEAIAIVVQMNRGFVHPNLNLVRPIDGECRFSPQESIETPIQKAMNNSFGFGGINSAVVFGRSDTLG